MTGRILNFYAAPSACSHQWLDHVEAAAKKAGFEVARSDDAASQGPDLTVHTHGDVGPEQTYLLAPDFTPARLANSTVDELAQRFALEPIPDAASTRQWSQMMSADPVPADRITLWQRPESFGFEVLGTVPVQYDNTARPADPALCVYKSDLKPGDYAFWAPALFHRHLPADERQSVSDWLDLTGLAKFIAIDPLVHLPRGKWQIEWLLELDCDKSLVDLKLLWGGQENVISFRRSGFYSYEQVAVNPAAGVITAQVMTAHPHFHGYARLCGAKVSYLGPLDPEA